jgi:hypothetical protein
MKKRLNVEKISGDITGSYQSALFIIATTF